MPFWDRAAKTAKDAADKAAFEGNKLVHIQREQGALNDLRGKAQARLCDLGRLALSLYQNGTLTDPSAAALAQEVADLEAQVNAQQAKIEGIKAEQYGSAPVAAYAPPASYSPAPTYGAPAQPSAPPPEPWSAAPPPPAPFDAAPPPPALPPISGPTSRVYPTPGGPAVGTQGGNGVQTYTAPGGGMGIVVPNGNGTSTLIAPDGTVTTVPNPR